MQKGCNSITCFFLLLFLSLAADGQNISKLVLVNATTDQDIGDLQEADVVDLNTTGTSLNIRAEIEGTVGSVRFVLNGQDNYHTENAAPYALAGDNNGDYNSWTPSPGQQTLVVRTYSGAGGSGDLLSTLTLNFFVVAATGEIVLPEDPGTGAMTMVGELKKWHKLSLSFDGPRYSESSIMPNPFVDYRLQVTFTHGDRSFVVPGYFAADGNSAETSAVEGNTWRVHFAPDAVGEWEYRVSFRIGPDIAVDDYPEAGTAVPPIDGLSGSFTIDPTDKSAPDNRGRGRLQYVGKHYLQFAETGTYFVKGGADAPENFLAYEDFDNTPNNGGRRKSWSPHAGDWKAGDPAWQDGKGTEIIGAVNYLASKGLNVFSFLTMNIGGDDKNVFPYVSDQDFLHFDCSKLDQWEIVFEHADQKGMYLHFKTQETENDQLLDNGALGRARKLYYRELVARYGHHLALNWNMGEENTQNKGQRIAMASWFKEHDPYDHHRVIHTYPGQTKSVYNDLIGDRSEYTGPSIQTSWNNVHDETAFWVRESKAQGKPWVVANDEQGNANTGVPPDPGYPGYEGSHPDLHDIRQEVLWGNLMAGGAGVEYYFGYRLPESDLSLQDFRSRDQSWDYLRFALNFFRDLPLTEMAPRDDLVNQGWCLAQPGEQYTIYLKNGGSVALNLPDAKTYLVQWYNPRDGTYRESSVRMVSGPGLTELGPPPSEPQQDWAIAVAPATSTSAESPLNSRHFKLYPNPASDQVQLELSGWQSAQLRLFALDGRLIRELPVVEEKNRLDIRDLPAGAYVLVLINGRIVGQTLLLVE